MVGNSAMSIVQNQQPKLTTLQMTRTHKPTVPDIPYTQDILIYIYLQKITHAIAHSPLSNHHNYTIFTNIQNINVSTYTTYIFIKLHDSTLLQCGLLCYGLLSESNDNKTND